MASSMQLAALKAIDRGWNPIPVMVKSKTPSRAWKEFQDRRLNRHEVDVCGKILIPDDARDHFLEEQHEAD